MANNPVPGGGAPMFIRASGNPDRRRITGVFMAQQAIWAEDAIPYKPGTPGEQCQFDAMLARGVIKRAGQGSYWLDTVAYTEDSRSRQARVGLIAGVLAVVLAGVLMLLYRL